MARLDVNLSTVNGLSHFNMAGTNYLVQTNSGVLYAIYIDVNSDVAFRKSTNGGKTWTLGTVISGAISAVQLSIWYDRWSGINSDLIHVCWSESAADDVSYRSINAANNDALSTITIAFAGASTATSGMLSIARARGGNIGIAYNIDGGTEVGFARSTDTGATWAARTSPHEAAADVGILMPGWAADNQDMMLFFWDISANEISKKLYDESANTWTETSIATGMTYNAATTAFPHFATAVDITNSQNLLVAWSAVDTANADLRCWKVTEASTTETTNIVLNSTDDQGLCSIGIDTATEDWYVAYGGKSDGTETWPTSINIYCKKSTDDGTTWSTEEAQTDTLRQVRYLVTAPRFTGAPVFMTLFDGTIDELLCNSDYPAPGGRITIV